MTEKDLADLQSPNVIVKKEALQRFARDRHFPFNLTDVFANKVVEKRAVAIMTEMLLSGNQTKEMEVRILKSLGQLCKRVEISHSPIVERLKDKNPEIRNLAAEILSRMKNTKAVPALIKSLEEDKSRYYVIWALGEIGDQRAIPNLNQLSSSDDEYVRYNARRALGKIRTPYGANAQDNPSGGGVSELGRIAFKKYQDAMMTVFEKITSLRRSRGGTLQ